MQNILLTRSSNENQALIEELKRWRFNCNTFSLPLISYNDLKFDCISIIANYQNLIITSKHAAKILSSALLDLCDNYTNSIDVWVVGVESANILSAVSIINVRYIAQNVNALLQHLPLQLYGNSIYLSGDIITKELPNMIHRKIIYKIIYLQELSAEQNDFLINIRMNCILLFSQNTAKSLNRIVQIYNLTQLKTTSVIAISEKVANIAKREFDDVICSHEPSATEMIKLLIRHAEKLF
ncbi:MAG: uroporphyrinogen-III synthase [Rickettsiaceae bacterium]